MVVTRAGRKQSFDCSWNDIYDVWLKTVIQSNLSKMVTLGTEESGRCGEVAGVPGEVRV